MARALDEGYAVVLVSKRRAQRIITALLLSVLIFKACTHIYAFTTRKSPPVTLAKQTARCPSTRGSWVVAAP